MPPVRSCAPPRPAQALQSATRQGPMLRLVPEAGPPGVLARAEQGSRPAAPERPGLRRACLLRTLGLAPGRSQTAP
eukprot:690684-Alexandrium_andersonii.AAC.1